MSIFAFEFVEKYKLIPKNLRVYCINNARVDNDTVYNEMNMLEDTLYYLLKYEREFHVDNYLELTWVLSDEIYFENHEMFLDLWNALVECLKKCSPVSKEGIVKFYKKLVMKDIIERVSYRPGNPGYERALEHFTLLCSKYM